MTKPSLLPSINWTGYSADAPAAIPLEVQSLRKSYGQITALDGLSLQLHPGELVALLGPNGAGKSTLVRCISGRVIPDAGKVLLRGRPAHRSNRSACVGWVPQEIALYLDLSARENLQIFGRLYGLSRSSLGRRTAWALDWTGLSDRADEPLQRLSGGMKRRINLACGVLHRPPVVLLDEPTVGVDPQSRERIFSMLDELRKEGCALLLTTHQLDEAEHRSDRILILDHGRLLATGTFQELVDRTLGEGRQVLVRLNCPPRYPIPGLHAHPNQAGTYQARVDNVVHELPELLDRLRVAGCEVERVDVRPPRLHDVYLQLTGRELRE